ncbi:MAG: hypothetical protein MJ175_12230, partial [Clostridia bacterium]|nr:hypothetical protein [Clostridia bacterium]
MHLRKALVCLLCLLAFVFVSCGNTETAEKPAVTDTPKNTAVLFSSLAEAWETAGGVVSITVGESVERGFATQDTPLVDDGAGKAINTELLLSLEPDLVICSADLPAQVEAA